MTENHNIIPARHIHEECGVFGIFTPQEEDVASYAYYALYSLQHRGQESAGIVVNDDGLFRSLRDTGLVSEVFRLSSSSRSARAPSPSAMCATARPAATTSATSSPF